MTTPIACIGIRREDKSIWERRAPLTPAQVQQLREKYHIQTIVQPSRIRVFSDEEYLQAGATVQEDLSTCPVILAVKEIPLHFFEPGKTYVFFSHTIKGQPYNMPMLQRMLELGCTLIDYEKITDEKGRRLVFFGRHAGLAGMIDTLWALGQRLAWEGIPNPFTQVRQAHTYKNLEEIKEALDDVSRHIQAGALPASLAPLIIGVAGYGNVSRGVQEILNLLPAVEIAPPELSSLFKNGSFSTTNLYKVVFKEEHTVEPVSTEVRFELQDFYAHPEKYRGRFESYLPYLTVMVNAIYWEARYPRLVTKTHLKELFSRGQPRLRVIGDISCDIEGAIECTVRSTEPGNPVYVYNPLTGETADGYAGPGVVIMAVDILPSELPHESSVDFGNALLPFIPAIAQADTSVDFDVLELPPPIKKAVIAYRGQLTPDYAYLAQYLPS